MALGGHGLVGQNKTSLLSTVSEDSNIGHYSLVALVGALLASCSSEKSGSGEGKLVTLKSKNPSDTTYTSGSVTLAFGTATDDAAIALDDTPPTKAIGDVTLRHAKLSIAKIKIKPMTRKQKIKETEGPASLAARPESEPSTRPKRPALENLSEKKNELGDKVKRV